MITSLVITLREGMEAALMRRKQLAARLWRGWGLADEPTGNPDKANEAIVMGLLEAQHRGVRR